MSSPAGALLVLGGSVGTRRRQRPGPPATSRADGGGGVDLRRRWAYAWGAATRGRLRRRGRGRCRPRPRVVADVRWAEAASDPLVAGCKIRGPSLHADAVTEPGRRDLAGGDRRVRASGVRVGASAWGVQFHPEVSLPTFRAWAEELPEVDTDAVTAELAARDDEVASAGRSLALRFAQVVAGRRRRGSHRGYDRAVGEQGVVLPGPFADAASAA